MHSNELATSAAASGRRPILRNVYAGLDRMLIKSLTTALGEHPVGRLLLTLPSGERAVFGTETTGVNAHLDVNSYRLLWKSLRRGPLGFAESYMAGDADTKSLKDLFDFYMDNAEALDRAAGPRMQSAKPDQAYHRHRANTRAGSRRNIAAHYDIGNAFYRHWLDAGLTYSSGLFPDLTATLEQAQLAKYNRIIHALDLEPGQDVLEIGCGWGGFVAAAAERGANVTAITISEQQLQATHARIMLEKLDHRASVRLEDYRDTQGQFDAIASIEMIEAVGAENWETYFQCLADRLKPGGKAVIQAITIRRDLYEGYRQNPDFVQRYIFPGGMLPTDDAMQKHAKAAGLRFETIQTFGASYALTLQEWQRRFEASWPRIAALGFDDRFRRMWNYYFSYCEVGFRRGTIDVGLYRMTKPL